MVDYLAELRRRNKRCRGTNERLEREMLRMFPPLESELVSAPSVVVDSEGRILLWYLPGLIGLKRQVTVIQNSNKTLTTYRFFRE
jgi:hypothetical protein